MASRYPVGSDGWASRARSRSTLRIGRKPFSGIDGEGGTRDGRHYYFYLRAGQRDLYNRDGSPLTTHQCLAFMADLPADRNYVGFFFDYDVTMILRDLTLERVRKLLHPTVVTTKKGRKMTLGVDWNEFQLSYRPGKEFKVRRNNGTEKDPDYTAWVTINDVGSFFQCSFVKACESWFGEWDSGQDGYVIHDARDRAIVDRIAAGKELRSEFHGLTDYIRDYCQLECETLARLMEKFRDAVHGVGLAPARWQGPGELVSSALKRCGFPKNKEYKERIPERVFTLAQAAYYGGRFEAPIIGDISGPIYQYDINSAYAASYRNLPCLTHGVWVNRPVSDASYPVCSIVRARFAHRPNEHICAFPVRDKEGYIFFPLKGNGVYWLFEVLAAKDRANVVIDEIWCYESRCSCRPFQFVDRLYEKRMEVGKKSGEGQILKITLASTYGKMCQSVGTAPYSNPIWASMITAYTRTMLYQAAISENDGKDVVMLATDGLFTTGERPNLSVSKEIGGWEADVHDRMFVIQSGMYFLPNKQPKTRGIPRVRIERQRDAIIEAWLQFIPTLRDARRADRITPPTVPIFLDQFVSITQAAAWGRLDKSGQWLSGTNADLPEGERHSRALSFDWRAKRGNTGRGEILGGALVTKPHASARGVVNHPYRKSIGGIVSGGERGFTINDLNEGQPDWNSFALG